MLIYVYKGREMLRRLKKLLGIGYRVLLGDDELLLLYFLENKALECIEDCKKMGIGDIEELENLIFHIHMYYEIPKALMEVKYSHLGNSLKEIIKKCNSPKCPKPLISEYVNFFTDIEIQRALERDIIFDLAKNLTFGFVIKPY